MAVEFHFLNASRAITDHDLSLVRQAAEEARPGLVSFLGDQNVDFIFCPSQNKKILHDFPVGGYAANPYTTYVYLEPRARSFSAPGLPTKIQETLFHEAHHNKRRGKPGLRLNDLKAALIFEGLAQAFEVEKGFSVPPYAVYLNENELVQASERARAMILRQEPLSDQKRVTWFFSGIKAKKLPPHTLRHWTGYSLGFLLTQAWLAETREKNVFPYGSAEKAACVSDQKIAGPWLKEGTRYLLRHLERTPSLAALLPK